MNKKQSTTLYCFSPPVMLATFVIELCLALYTLIRYKLTPITRLAIIMLVGLSIFQIAEYNVCVGAWGIDSLGWSRVGYVAITLLPPLGIHLATRIAGQRQRLLVSAGYAAAAAFALFFLLVGQGMQSSACLGNYVIFRTAPWASLLYGLYYYGLLFVGVGYAWWAAKKQKSKHAALALRLLALGYIAFILPTTTVNLIDPSTRAGIPSIMCGFAVILALLLALWIVPEAVKAPSSGVRKK